ncbi:hypothetical protein MP478_16445 [Chryseobacterium sp. WG14]|uniref:hypothetical protein n=1 Tax=Chryseobacterium sp. WG14 TaxID=2926909 RepID=UPI00211DDFCD|nr:hypothetical protein [Chryseobacterium sp. WG14]MCQ9640975.1 hypothetical protein [Chryseobacterium sp. WG14]
MSLQIKQKHQFFSKEYDVNLDVLEMSNGEMYLNLEQVESLFQERFEDYMIDQCKNTTYRTTYPKACQYFDIYGYASPEDFEKDMILEIENAKWYSFSYLCPYIAKHNDAFSENLCEFYRTSIIIFHI